MEKMNNNRARSLRQVRSSRSKRGVSPVIGVILMVAATIVIAGVVMAMLGGFSPPHKTYAVSAQATQIEDDIVVTYMGGPDDDYVASVKITRVGTDTAGHWINNTGDSYTATGQGTPGKDDHVVVVATFDDGSTQVILDTYV